MCYRKVEKYSTCVVTVFTVSTILLAKCLKYERLHNLTELISNH